MSNEQSTHFGFKTVAEGEKAKKVGEVFHSVASKYDLMNDVMSAGLHRTWKRFAVEISGVKAGDTVLDIAGGSGDLSKLFAQKVGASGRVILPAINASMLSVGRDRLTDKGITGNVHYAQVNAECLPFADNTFDCICIAYGLRNVTDKDAALRSMYRVLKPGGRAMVLEFSKPRSELVSKAYDGYSALWPIVGKLVTGDADSYRYLVESIRMHPDQVTLKKMMEDAGFTDCRYHDVMGGICAIHLGFKSPHAS